MNAFQHSKVQKITIVLLTHENRQNQLNRKTLNENEQIEFCFKTIILLLILIYE